MYLLHQSNTEWWHFATDANRYWCLLNSFRLYMNFWGSRGGSQWYIYLHWKVLWTTIQRSNDDYQEVWLRSLDSAYTRTQKTLPNRVVSNCGREESSPTTKSLSGTTLWTTRSLVPSPTKAKESPWQLMNWSSSWRPLKMWWVLSTASAMARTILANSSKVLVSLTSTLSKTFYPSANQRTKNLSGAIRLHNNTHS